MSACSAAESARSFANSMKAAMIVTMAMTPIANFIMNYTSCVTT